MHRKKKSEKKEYYENNMLTIAYCSAEDTGSNYSCVIYNPTISGQQIYKNITLVVRCK